MSLLNAFVWAALMDLVVQLQLNVLGTWLLVPQLMLLCHTSIPV